MSEKIKSITITQPLKATFYTTGTTKIEKDGNGFCITGDNLEIFIRPTSVETVEYEQDEPEKPKQIFFPNGAVVKPLEENQRYWYIDSSNGISSYIWNEDETDFAILESQNAFLTEESAEKAKKVKDTHNRLLKRVMEINAEQGWAANWMDGYHKKYYVDWDHEDDKKDWSGTYQCQKQVIVMSKEAKDWLMSDDVSDQDFKSFCLIYE